MPCYNPPWTGPLQLLMRQTLILASRQILRYPASEGEPPMGHHVRLLYSRDLQSDLCIEYSPSPEQLIKLGTEEGLNGLPSVAVRPLSAATCVLVSWSTT